MAVTKVDFTREGPWRSLWPKALGLMSHLEQVTVEPPAWVEELSTQLEDQLVCLDPQTSGGLLVAITPEASSVLIRTLADRGVNADVIGQVEQAPADDPLLVRLI